MSIEHLARPEAGEDPVGPSVTDSSASVLVTIEKTTSTCGTTSRGESAQLHALIDQPLRFRPGPVVAGDACAPSRSAVRHPAAHHAEPDVSEICHDAGRQDA